MSFFIIPLVIHHKLTKQKNEKLEVKNLPISRYGIGALSDSFVIWWRTISLSLKDGLEIRDTVKNVNTRFTKKELHENLSVQLLLRYLL